MGCPFSKSGKNRRGTVNNGDKENAPGLDNDSTDAAATGIRDNEIIDMIKKDLNETPELFVLNNVLMCTIFLRNYQEEVQQVIEQLHKVQDNFLEPDIFMSQVNKNAIYRPMHGPKKDIAEPLVTRRIYVPMNEYVEVHNTFDDMDDDTSNGSSKYQVKIEDSKRQGFVKLQRVNVGNSPDGNSLKEVLLVPSSTTSGSSDTESTCTSIGLPVSENLQLVRDHSDQGTLEDCFVFRKVKKPDIDLNMEELDHENLKEEDIYDIVSYLPSRKFMKYFQSKVFKESIAEQLGLDQFEIENAVVDEHIPGKIFCNLKDTNDMRYPVELMPCLTISWPSKQTYDFMERNLPQHQPQDPDKFQWPTVSMLRRIQHLQCTLVPKGYSRKRGAYPEGDLEWEIHFPLAESLLATYLRPEQIICYLIFVTMFKEYLEPYTRNHGIVPEHFLTLIFWEAERDYHAWPKHRLGIPLIRLIQRFSNCLKQKTLMDFFVRKKNVLKSISRNYLTSAGEVFHNIKQSPTMSIIRALRNVRYTSGKFYPPLNYKELLNILYRKDWNDNPYISNLSMEYYNNDQSSLSISSSSRKPRFSDAERQLKYIKQKEIKKKLEKTIENKKISKSTPNLTYSFNCDTRRGSSDSIDDDWECEKPLDRQKKIALLKFFINNYLDIAQASYKLASKKQTMFYLEQAWYLTKILEEENQLFAEEVAELFKKIKLEKQKVMNAINSYTNGEERSWNDSDGSRLDNT